MKKYRVTYEVPVTVSLAAYEGAVDVHMGWCPQCEEFTRSNTEPDASEYDCPVCGGNEVMGAEQALITEAIEVKE